LRKYEKKLEVVVRAGINALSIGLETAEDLLEDIKQAFG
jgi:O-acetylhomoserine/O-acetylserine sulfhydrylase-like pyridoxal-dependent enzyme